MKKLFTLLLALSLLLSVSLAETPAEACGANPADDAGRDGSVCSDGTAASLQPPHEIVARIDLAADKSRGIYDASMLETLDIEADLIMDFSKTIKIPIKGCTFK